MLMAHFPDLSGMALFVRIVEEGSLSAASRALGLPKATVSRRLRLLEHEAGAPLVARSTRSLSLTDPGRRYYERVRSIVHEAQSAQAELVADNAEPSGLLRVSASLAYGQMVVVPRIVSFAARHPRVRVEVHLSDERVNLIADGYDLVIRMGGVEDSELMGRSLGDVPIVIVAAPGYLERRGVPACASDLSDHDAVVVLPGLDHWQVGAEMVKVRWRLSTGSMSAVRVALLAGLGIARVPEFVVADDLATGALVRLLPDAPLPRATATALYARARTASPAIRKLLEELRELPEPRNA